MEYRVYGGEVEYRVHDGEVEYGCMVVSMRV